MNLQGTIVNWLKPKNEIDFSNPIENVDYEIVLRNNQYPNSDGSAVVFDGYPTYEWLTNVQAPQPPYDDRFYILLVKDCPTNTPDSTNGNINIFTQKYGLERRPTESIIASIRQEQQAANNSLYSESDYKTMTVLCNGWSAATAQGNTPSLEQQNAYERNADVEMKILANASNADALIDAVTQGLTPDISSGWEADHIVPAYPFQ